MLGNVIVHSDPGSHYWYVFLPAMPYRIFDIFGACTREQSLDDTLYANLLPFYIVPMHKRLRISESLSRRFFSEVEIDE